MELSRCEKLASTLDPLHASSLIGRIDRDSNGNGETNSDEEISDIDNASL